MKHQLLHSSGSTLPKIILAIAMGVAVVIVATAGGAYLFLVKPPMEAISSTAHDIAAAFNRAFHFTPMVVAGERTIIEQTRPALKLTLVERDIHEMIEWSQTWVASTKMLTIEGTYRASAGFDLDKHFRVSMEENPTRISAQFPRPELLALEVKNHKVLKDESGWWNKIQPQEREALLNQLHEKARRKAEQSGILDDVKLAVEKRLSEIAARHGCLLEIRYSSENLRPEMKSPAGARP